MPCRRALPALLLLLFAGAACAQVRHCQAADGTDIYTDKRCDQLDAVPAPPRPQGGAGAAAYRPGCARNLRDLAFELRAAIDSQDVNRLAASYDWSGMPTRPAYAVLDRLAAIAQRPLVDIVPLPAGGADDAGGGARRAPYALRLEQTLRDRATPAPTTLSLHRALGCWWVRL